MNIFYFIRHEFSNLPEFEELKSTSKIAFLLTLSQIAHFSKSEGHCDFRVRKMVDDTGISRATFNKTLKLLQDAGYIKCIRPYQRKGSLPGRYLATASITKALKQYNKSTQPVSQVYTVKDIQKISNQEEDVSNNPSPPSNGKLNPEELHKLVMQLQNNKK